MDRNKLTTALHTFIEACNQVGYPIIINGLSEAYPGVVGTSMTVHIHAGAWSDEMSRAEILDILLPILWESVSENVRQTIFSLDVYNANGSINCHHLNTFNPLALAS